VEYSCRQIIRTLITPVPSTPASHSRGKDRSEWIHITICTYSNQRQTAMRNRYFLLSEEATFVRLYEYVGRQYDERMHKLIAV